MNIFILEDSYNRIKKFKMNLIGHTIIHTDNINDAKSILKSNKFDCIFLDHDLGEVDIEYNNGYQLAKWIAQENITYTRLIVHSSNTVGSQNIKFVIPQAELIPFTRLFI